MAHGPFSSGHELAYPCVIILPPASIPEKSVRAFSRGTHTERKRRVAWIFNYNLARRGCKGVTRCSPGTEGTAQHPYQDTSRNHAYTLLSLYHHYLFLWLRTCTRGKSMSRFLPPGRQLQYSRMLQPPRQTQAQAPFFVCHVKMLTSLNLAALGAAFQPGHTACHLFQSA